MEFERGKFTSFRAVTKVHLGSIEQDILEGDVVSFDGQTVKISGTDYNIPSLRSAIKQGWFVPEGTPNGESAYKPKAAAVEVRPAQSAGRERGKPMGIQTVQDEERDLGSIKKVRDRGDGIIRKVQREGADDEGVVVAKIRTPAEQKTLLTDSNRASQEIHRLDNSTPPKPKVREPDALDEFLGIENGDGAAPVEAVVAAAPVNKAEAAGRAEQARQARLAQVSGKPEPKVEAKPEVEALDSAKLSLVRAVVPDFQWDISTDLKARVKKALSYKKQPLYLYGILAVESEPARKLISKALAASK
jgi:hypothetical protein